MKFFFIVSIFIFTVSLKIETRRRYFGNDPKRVMAPIFEDIEALANKFVFKVARQHNNEILWWEMYGNNPVLRRKNDFQFFKVNFVIKNMVYGKPVKKDAKIRSPVSHWLENFGTEPKFEEFVCDYTTHETHIWRVTKGLISTKQIKASIKYREGIQPEFERTVNLKEPKMQISVNRQHSFKSRFRLEIPPKKAASVDCFVTGTVTDIPWSVDVELDGWIAVWFKHKVNKHYLWFYRITELENEFFKKSSSGCSLIYNAAGVFRRVSAIDSNHIFYEHDVTTSNDTDDTHKPCNLTADRSTLSDNDPCKYQTQIETKYIPKKNMVVQKSTKEKLWDEKRKNDKVATEKIEQFVELKPSEISHEMLPPIL